ncbi:MAG: glutathione S-transferase family protein [Pseudomonadota bacterium]
MSDRPILIGKFLSPYVRRVGITLTHYGVAFDRLPFSAIDDREERERYNPLGRVPALALSDGRTLVDSAAIIDHFDELAGDDALTPQHGSERVRVLQQVAISTGTIDKLMAANAERRRPAERQMSDRLALLKSQALAGFDALEALLGGQAFFGTRFAQGDLTASVALSFANHIFPDLVDPKRFPALSAQSTEREGSKLYQECAID